MNQTEALAAYIGVIRHELKLPRGSDALVELETRLRPEDARERPPTRAPGIVRLRKAVREIRAHTRPASTLDQFAEDLQFLRLFEPEPAWTASALESLLADVDSVPSRRRHSDPPRNVVPMRQSAPKEDA